VTEFGAVPVEPRVPLLGESEAVRRGEEVGVPDYLARLNVFRVLLHQPPVAKAVHGLLDHLLFGSTLDRRLRELVIMRLGWRTGSVYEWTQHWGVATWMEIDGADIVGCRQPDAHDGFGEAERAVLAATDETLDTGTVSPPTFERCVSACGGDHAAVIELIASIGTWQMVAGILRSLEVPLEDGMAPWPPDGVAPAPPAAS